MKTQTRLFCCVRLVFRIIAALAFVEAGEIGLCLADGITTNRLSLMVQVSDFRQFQSASADFKKMIESGKALLEVRGIIHLKGGAIPESATFDVNEQTNLEEFLKLSGIELEVVKGVQLRLIKRDIIIQTPRFYQQQTVEHYNLMKKMSVEPGDIVIITKQE